MITEGLLSLLQSIELPHASLSFNRDKETSFHIQYMSLILRQMVTKEDFDICFYGFNQTGNLESF